ncbi:MAG: hypothetical protein V7603_4681 [Micromonosporaceae bacterium]
MAGTFDDLVAQVRGTVFARDHGLSGAVRTVTDWQKAIPIRGYEGFTGYVDQQLGRRPKVLTRNGPYAFLRTSGTSGRPKVIPTTDHWRRRYRGPALYAQWGLYFEHLRAADVRPDSVIDLSWAPSVDSERIGGFPVYSITQRPGARTAADWAPPWLGMPWFGGDSSDLYPLIRWLSGRDVRLVVSVNPSRITLLAECLREHTDQLLRDLYHGTLRGGPHPALHREPALVRRLEVARDARGQLELADLWPELSLCVCWRSASTRLYQPWLARIVAGADHLPFSATGTEGIVTIPTDGHPSAGPLAVDQGLFEFVPWHDDDAGTALPPDAPTVDPLDVEVGSAYRLVMSQANGLYRYDTGDVYAVAGRVGRVPRLEFLRRAGFQSSFTGEKLTDSDVYAATCRALGVASPDCPLFTCVPVWAEPPFYTAVIERSSEDAPVTALAARLDRALQDVNVEYADKRRSRRIAPLVVRLVPPGTFRRVDASGSRAGTSQVQAKHLWIQRDAALLSVLDRLAPVEDRRAA